LPNSPQVLLADEPTANLDTATGNCILEFCTSLTHANSTATLMVRTSEAACDDRRPVDTLRDGPESPDIKRQMNVARARTFLALRMQAPCGEPVGLTYGFCSRARCRGGDCAMDLAAKCRARLVHSSLETLRRPKFRNHCQGWRAGRACRPALIRFLTSGGYLDECERLCRHWGRRKKTLPLIASRPDRRISVCRNNSRRGADAMAQNSGRALRRSRKLPRTSRSTRLSLGWRIFGKHSGGPAADY